MWPWVLMWACGGVEPHGKQDTAVSTPPIDSSTTLSPVTTDTGIEDTSLPTPPEETGDSGGTTPPPVLTADCVLDADHALRAWCEVTVSPAAAVTVFFGPASGAVREAVSPEASVHLVPLTVMPPETRIDFRVEAAGLEVTGQFETSVVPVSTQMLTTGTPSWTHLMLASPCGESAVAIILDADGVPVWYHDFSLDGMGDQQTLDGVTWTEDGTVLGLVNRQAVVEVDLAGRTLLDLRHGEDFHLTVHHDLFRRDGHTYVLFQEVLLHEERFYLLDGFYVFDEAGEEVAKWRLWDHFQPPAPGPYGDLPGAIDYSHANSIWVEPDGDVLVSFRHLDAVVMLEGDWTAAGFGELLWRLAGDDRSPLGSDMTLIFPLSPHGFRHQHNAHFEDGLLVLFDNRVERDELSRVLRLDVDPAAGVARLGQAWTMTLGCPYQGSAWHTEAGHPLAMCAPLNEGVEFDVETGDVRWTGSLSCGDGASMAVPRLIPVSL